MNVPNAYKPLLFWFAFATASLFSIKHSYNWFAESRMPDLRIKVTGSRLMRDNKLPYFYKWKAGDDEIYCNPYDRPGKVVNGLSVPPSILWLMESISKWNYCTIMKFWFWLQEILLFTSALIVILLIGTWERKLASSVILFTFITTKNWFFYIEQGQIYALYSLAFALLYLIHKRCKSPNFLSAICISFFTWLRPLFLLTALPNLIAKNKKITLTLVFAAFILIAFTTLTGQWKYWKEYNAAIKQYSKEVK